MRLALTGMLTLLVGVSGCGGSSQSSPVQSTGARPLNAADCYFQYSLASNPFLTGADPLIDAQWHLNNTGQNGGVAGEDLRAFQAWATSLGAGVRLAVIDDAIEIVHEDLAPNAVAGASYNYRADARDVFYPLPCLSSDEHGTAVAGVALAVKGNQRGGAGVAPLASLVGLNALATSTDADIADALNRDLQANAIYNVSWGSPDDGRLHRVDDSFRTAIDSGLRTGRGGKGSIYVFAGGNGACYYGTLGANDACDGYDDNPNYDTYSNLMGVNAICAVGNDGRRAWYSERGANLLVCAPSGNRSANVVTTALRSGYQRDFSGTSATAPMVSGVVALMLSANPDLTWRDVRLILARSARKNDPTDPGWSTAYGYHFNHQYGFGVVDAQAAVALARGWTSVGGSQTLGSCGPYTRSPGTPIPDGSASAFVPITDTITVPAGCAINSIEFVEVSLHAPHAYSGDLRVRLISPSGLVSELADTRRCFVMDDNGEVLLDAGGQPQEVSCGDYGDDATPPSVPAWTFGSNRHMGESPRLNSNGQWRIELADRQAGNTGRLVSWSIRFWGR